MSTFPSDEILKGFAEEVRGYVATLTKGIESLHHGEDRHKVCEEMHRLVHTIKGAASLVGMHGLSQIACQMEEALEEIIGGKLTLSEGLLQLMADTVNRFEKYFEECPGEREGEEGVLARQVAAAYGRFRGMPAADDVLAPPALSEAGRAQEAAAAGHREAGGAGLLDVETAGSDPELLPPADDDVEVPHAPGAAAAGGMDALGGELLDPEAAWLDPELLGEFYQEAQEHLEELNTSLSVLEEEVNEPVTLTAGQRELLRRMRRSVHTIKGAAAVVGIGRVSTWAHTMEDLLDWIYEKAQEIGPEAVALLVESADLLESLVLRPDEPDQAKLLSLSEEYGKFIGPDHKAVETSAAIGRTGFSSDGGEAAGLTEPVITGLSGEKGNEVSEESSRDGLSGPTNMLRVGIERADELVNLAGEIMIALSAFEQKMEIFKDLLDELELSRKRLKETARDLELGYEVKALQRLRPTFPLQLTADGRTVQTGDFGEFDALELDRYSEFNVVLRTLQESVIDVGAISSHLAGVYSNFDGFLTRKRVLLSELQHKLMGIRMKPMATIANRLRHAVREVAGTLGKKVRLVIEGQGIELDRMVWDRITDPLLHLVRNAVDHGIELPALRRARMKPDVGTVRVTASREGGQVVIRVADDGAGLDFDAVRRAARKAGLLNEQSDMSEEELASIIFDPGFSTRVDISEVSGRGVGLDVVNENVRELKGSVRVASTPGKGTQFTLSIPLTLAVVRALVFTVGGRTFAMPLNEVREIARVRPEDVMRLPENSVRLGAEVLPLRHLAGLLDLEESESSTVSLVLVIESGGRREALGVDGLIGQKEIVIKSLASHQVPVKGIAGATILGDGSVLPILNVDELLAPSTRRHGEPASPGEAETRRPLEVLVVDDSVSIRQVVSRLMEDQGWRTRTAKDGVEALERLAESRPDVIVLDLEMPRMNGYEFMGAVRAQRHYQDIPIIVLTSRSAAKHREKATAFGAKGFITKPYNDGEFVDLVLRLTQTHAGDDGSPRAHG